MLDYIIVGSGLAGISFAETVLQKDKTILVVDSEQRSSSLVAGGMYNPVVLKRFTEVWKVREQLDIAYPFFKSLEDKLQVTLDHKLPLLRRFSSVEEQNNWFEASDKPNLSTYLSSQLIKNVNQGVHAPFSFGEVFETGYVDTALLIEKYRSYLKSSKQYLCEDFDFTELTYNSDFVTYKGIKAKNIVFAEGYGMLANPFFRDLPLDGTKGELLIVRIPQLKFDEILKAGVFLIPIGNDLYKVGATYDWEDKTDAVSEKGKEELLEGLKSVINLEFEIVEHIAGVRPTVKDRRPLVGHARESSRIHVLNGLGTRGVLLGPFLARELYQNIEQGVPLDVNISIERFYKKKL
ncbi:FAD-binding oxidoreductase [Flavobacterium sp. HSC-61S13]|uniref:NAD(P)/FAD-dependent oxidoreductase n=1 Tax=Flavobacterium sp. HSC-61S13 TaxID=2910963 RepID=UPI00209C7A60|nr:FAD-binding oxidoreductase [Flavobacterium sp. HSC-61S13]MCP1994920.1 glycine/D-amino acid oxidase-like deaminating enzyme [Flavobacterium sp. HSC-61S13]